VEFPEDSYGYRVYCPHCDGEILIPELDRPPPKIASIHSGLNASPAMPGMPAGPDAPASPADAETEVFEIAPMARAFAGQILLGLVLSVVVVGLFILLHVWITLRSIRYRLTSQRLFVRRGFIARHLDELELFRIKDVLVEQSIIGRLMNIGNVTVLSSDENTPCVNIIGVLNPVRVKEVIRAQCRASRRHEGMRPAELMQS
jgi:membrane protein YdbS with pleckstrin-like domain